MKKKNARKMLTIIPLVCLLSTPIIMTPVTTFAIETQPTNSIKGYGLPNEITHPKLSPNPNDFVPIKGNTYSEQANMGTIIYASEIAIPSFIVRGVKGIWTDVYIEKLNNGNIQIGYFDIETLERDQPFATINPNDEIWKTGFPEVYTFYNSLFIDNTIKRETVFEKIESSTVPKNSTYTFNQTVTSGLTKEDAKNVALTFGYALSFKETNDIISAEMTDKLSALLSSSYNQTIPVSSAATNTQILSNPKAPDSYTYDTYIGAVYQLHSTYTIQPGVGLKQAISQNKIKLVQQTIKCKDTALYLTVTPGAKTIQKVHENSNQEFLGDPHCRKYCRIL